MLREEFEVFAIDDTDIGNVDYSNMKIRLKDDILCQALYNSIPHPLHQELKHVEDLLKKQWTTNSHSESLSPVVAMRKTDGTLRLCCGYRMLNAKTIPDRYPLPRVQDIIKSFGKNQCFSLLDQTKAYHQLQMDPESRKIPAFLTPRGFYECLRLPIGRMNAPAYFQRFMKSCLGNI